jgi:hypothetical protein
LAVGGWDVGVGGTGVAVGGRGVAVGGTGVAVGGNGVLIGGGVSVGRGVGVAVGGTDVLVGGMGDGVSAGTCVFVGSGVLVGAGVSVAAGRVAVGLSSVEVSSTATTVGASVGCAAPQATRSRAPATRVISSRSRQVLLQRSLVYQAGMPACPFSFPCLPNGHLSRRYQPHKATGATAVSIPAIRLKSKVASLTCSGSPVPLSEPASTPETFNRFLSAGRYGQEQGRRDGHLTIARDWAILEP